MKQIALLVVALGFLGTGAARAGVLDRAPRFVGSVELRAPVWAGNTASAESHWNNLEMAGDLRVLNVLGPLVLAVHGEHTFHQAGIFAAENKLKVGLELPLGHSLTAFTYWDRRFAVNVDRVFVGMRYGFGGRL